MSPDLISRLLPKDVVLSIATSEMYQDGLFAEEAAAVSRAVAQRREEFTAGRNCARNALAQLGGPRTAIPIGPDREPLWPVAFVGSITHTEGLCAAVAARASEIGALGLDAEAAHALDAQLIDTVCRPDERQGFAELPRLASTTWADVTFSAKEAFYKCHFPIARRFLEFQEVRLRLWKAEWGERGGFEVVSVDHDPAPEISRRVVGAWVSDGRHVVCLAATLANGLVS